MKKLKHFVFKYHIITFTLTQMLFWPLHMFFINLWLEHHPRTGEAFQPTEDAVIYLVRIVFIAAWLAAIIFIVLQTHYSDVSGGRSFFADRHDFELSYDDLIRFYKRADPIRMEISELPYATWKEIDGIPLGHLDDQIIYRSTDGQGNIMIFGLPGFNKTTTSIATAALRFGATVPESYFQGRKKKPKTTGSCVVVDFKGDVLHWTKKKRYIKVFNPEDPNSIHFDPLLGIENLSLSDRRTEIEKKGYIILPQKPKASSEEDYFSGGGRDFFCGIALLKLHENIRVPFMEIIQDILRHNHRYWIDCVKESSCEEAKEFIMSMDESNEKNIAGCYGALAKACREFTKGALPVLLTKSKNCISSKILDAGWDIYIEIAQSKLSVYGAVTTLLIQQLMTEFMNRPDSSTGVKNRPVLFILDELPKLNFNFNTLEECLSTLRSKSVTCLMAAQSIAQYRLAYGTDAFTALVDCSQYVCCLAALENSSREWFSNLMGNHSVLKRSITDGKITVQEVEEPVIRPEQFSKLADMAVIFAVGQGHVIADKCKVFE